MWYYYFTGLLSNIFERNIYKYPLIQYAQKLKEPRKRVIIKDVIGMIGFYSGSNIHIVDPGVLSDPLLSILPSTEFWRGGYKENTGEKKWLTGHFTMKIPIDYLETITTGKNEIQDMYLRKYYDKLSFVTRGNLFDFNRLIET